MKPGSKLPVANVDDEVTVVEAAEEFNFARFEGPDRCLKKLVDSFDRRAFDGWRALDGGARFLLEFDDVMYLMESWRDMRGTDTARNENKNVLMFCQFPGFADSTDLVRYGYPGYPQARYQYPVPVATSTRPR